MAHEIFGERFYSLRVPAWHNLGIVAEEEAGALATLALLGEPIVTIQPITTTLPDGTLLEMPERAIVRHPTPDDDEYVPFGIVGPEYQLITAADICTIWDEYVNQPVETAGFLRRGSTFFITSKLPSVDVRGDEVEMYLGAVAPTDGLRGASCEIWPLRVVCANTLGVAQQRATASYKVVHDSSALERMGAWLADMYREAAQSTAVLKEAFEVLAGYKVTRSAEKHILMAAYPDPAPRKVNAPAEVMAVRAKDLQYVIDRQIKLRAKATELFKGAGTGAEMESAQGTGWGLYNAIVEVEDYRRGWNGGGLEAQRVAESALFGERADAKARAFETALEIASKG